MSKLITIAGPLGIGKTTLGSALSQQLGYVFLEESFLDNPYLESATQSGLYMYENILWFIESDYKRYQKACMLRDQGIGAVIDKPFFEEFTYISLAGLTPEQEFTCQSIVEELMGTVRLPDLVIDLQLQTSTLVDRISSRGREFEGTVSESWLTDFQRTHTAELNRIPDLKKLILDSERYDFRDETHINEIHKMVIESLNSS